MFKKNTITIIVAAGESSRTVLDKLFIEILPGTSVLKHSIDVFMKHDAIDEVIVVTGTNHVHEVQKLLETYEKSHKVVQGGNSRFISVYNGILAIINKPKSTRVIIHNAANTYLEEDDLTHALTSNCEHLVFAYPATSTYKVANSNNVITKHLEKNNLYEAQTPQITTLGALVDAYEKAFKEDKEFRDESELLSYAGYVSNIYPCSYANKKITFWKDLPGNYVFGYGEDTHKFLPEYDTTKPLVLGGVQLREQLSLYADSDGDVLLHAVTNALLSLAGKEPLGSIADDMTKQGILSSQDYLKKALSFVEHGYTFQYVVIHIEALIPKLSPYHEKIINSLSSILNLPPGTFALTYETGDWLSPFGQGKGIRAYCTILCKKLHLKT